MADLIRQGLEISALGLGLTFAALAMLIVMMMLLERLFRPKRAITEEPSPTSSNVTAGRTEEEEIAGAIGVALIQWQIQASQRGELGRRLEAGRGRWWSGVRSSDTSHFAAWDRKENR